ncbi:MAG: CRISPR-associated helicase Cas3' [Bacillota bacterium]|nr:CRISPR-associated helicase Cas3' [Bacillota bacterium]
MKDNIGAAELWAKSKGNINVEEALQARTILGHSETVFTAFCRLFGSNNRPTRLADSWLHFFGLDNSSASGFLINGMAVSLLHDLGKANSGFQDAVNGRRDAQLIRHEHLSGLILSSPALESWLKSINNLNYEVVISAVVGHHFKAAREECFKPLNADRKNFIVYTEAVNDLLSLLADKMDLEKPVFDLPTHWSFGSDGLGGLEDLREKLKHRLQLWSRHLKPEDFESRMLMAVRSALIASDSAGSCFASGRLTNPYSWLDDAFAQTRQLKTGYVKENIIDPRMEQLRLAGKWKGWHDFQDAVSSLPERTLLLAPCGSGKTMAAWRWLDARLTFRPASRLIFLYPTRATATEGFKDYVAWAPESDGALMHGTAAYELEGMFDNPADSRAVKEFAAEEKLFAMAYWQRSVFSATVDQFLGFMQNSYRSACLLPVLTDSILVIDEVHSFDRSLFAMLKKFLKTFNLPVLCMTASLQPERVNDLVECGLTLFPGDSNRFADLDAIASMPRYRVELIESRQQGLAVARKGSEIGQKVLYVVNTVARCQELALELGALCYHSRFKLEDRKIQHNKAIDAFKTESGPVIVVTTQVCEMSLDLDADILITEVAPVPALIQRMGRCNRHARPGSGRIGSVFVYEPESSLPYSTEEIKGSAGFLSAAQNRDISQACLQELLEIHGISEVVMDRYASFVDCGPWAGSRELSLRDETGYNVSAILDGDIERYLEYKKNRIPADGLYLQVPAKNADYNSRVGPRPLVAPSSCYSKELGFRVQ